MGSSAALSPLERYLLFEERAFDAFSQISFAVDSGCARSIKVSDFSTLFREIKDYVNLPDSENVTDSYVESIVNELHNGGVTTLSFEDFKAYFNFLQDRIRFASVRVAVIGAGVSGLSCANFLANEGIHCTVFEREQGVGGRMVTRRVQDDLGNVRFQFDYGSPCIQPQSTVMRDLMKEWEVAGIVAPWRGRFGSYDCKLRRFFLRPDPLEDCDRYVGIPGMDAICKHLVAAEGVDLHTSVSAQHAKQDATGKWALTLNGDQVHGGFDVLVVSDMEMVERRFEIQTSDVAEARALNVAIPMVGVEVGQVLTTACFVTMFALEEPLQSLLFSKANMLNNDVIATLLKESSKPGRATGDGKECWVMHSTTQYAERAILEHEDDNIDTLNQNSEEGQAMLTAVANEMLAELRAVLPEGEVMPKVVYSSAYLWSSAFKDQEGVPQGTPGQRQARRSRYVSYREPKGVLSDEKSKIVFCGDWLGTNCRNGCEDAAISGIMTAKSIARML